MARKPLILICDDDPLFHLAVKHALGERYSYVEARDGEQAAAAVKTNAVDLVLLDVRMRTPDEGLRAIPRLKEADPELSVVMTSGDTDFRTVREALRLGADDYVAKDFDPNALEHVTSQALTKRAMLKRQSQHGFESMATQKRHVLIGSSPAMRELRSLVEKVRSSPANVVITGETGTGKEAVARHLRAKHPDGSLAPFVAVDSSTIQSSTAESALFGHERGAFTGAERTTKGIFEEANGGIVYFDEISNMPIEIQGKLLRVLQEKEVSRMGSSRVIPLEFRVVCATNRNLEELAASGAFKNDLLQRLNVIPIELPPLRERKDDIPELVSHFLARHLPPGRAMRFTEEALEALARHAWPGNVRELGNLVAYLVALAEGEEIDVSDLPPRIRDASARKAPGQDTFYARVAEFERGLLEKEYRASDGNVSRLAMRLGMDRSHLHSKLKELGIRPQSRN